MKREMASTSKQRKRASTPACCSGIVHVNVVGIEVLNKELQIKPHAHYFILASSRMVNKWTPIASSHGTFHPAITDFYIGWWEWICTKFLPFFSWTKDIVRMDNTEEGRRIIMEMRHNKNEMKNRAASDGSYWRGCQKEPKTALEVRKEEGSLMECVLALVSQ